MRADFLTPALLLCVLSACGGISMDGGAAGGSLNEPIPAGATLLRQGAITSTSTVVFTGSAQVYQGLGGAAVIRLAGFSTDGAGVYLFLETTLSPAYYTAPLKAIAGQQNYVTGLPVAGQVFSRVVFRATANPNDPEIGSAILLSVN